MGKSYVFRCAAGADRERIWEIILQAKAQMLRQAKQQWDESYPAPDDIDRDLAKGYGYVLADDTDMAICYGAVIFDGEPVYEKIAGKWLSDGPYVVVHRLAVADEMKHRGIATLFMEHVAELALSKGVGSFRVDTNFDNFYMHSILERLGFMRCGDVIYEEGLRWAYEKPMP